MQLRSWALVSNLFSSYLTQVPFLCLSFTTYNVEMRALPGCPELKNLRLSAGDGGSTPDGGTKIPHATVQLSPRTTTREAYMLQLQKALILP